MGKNGSIYSELAINNDFNYNLLKAAEECTELTELLLKKVTKKEISKQPTDQSIIDEIGDVYIRIKVLMKLFGEDECYLRIVNKLKKCENHLKKNGRDGKSLNTN